jgi:hypothetical protein
MEIVLDAISNIALVQTIPIALASFFLHRLLAYF